MTDKHSRTFTADTPQKIGETVNLYGWVHAKRNMGQIVFVDLRDGFGRVQVVFDTQNSFREQAEGLKPESVVKITGQVVERQGKAINAKIPTGKVEIQATGLEILNESETPPFEIGQDKAVDEELRLKYRYLDLRHGRIHANLLMRHQVVNFIRNFLNERKFTEIETPILTAPTPEGARDYMVPSRMYPGKFFALPQSPQQYKQLLMVAGFERYFQIARCFRDEDLRADRGFEHTQIDLEVSFTTREELMQLDEEMITTVSEAMGHKIKEKPFPRFSYKKAIEKFGADKFDLRNEEEKKNGILAFAWVIDFPFFEKDKEGKWTFTHNPFSMPAFEHLEWHLKGENVDKIITQQYDLVCNGYETGGGSIRAHKPEILKATFKTMGYGDAQIEKDFGHMLKAFSYGTPPHGGIAHGIERMIMILTGEKELREVQSFPQTSSGHTAVMDAPSELSKEQLKELGIELKKSKN